MKNKKIEITNYYCECCNYKTEIEKYYTHHLTTWEHKVNQMTKNKKKDTYKCLHCCFETTNTTVFNTHMQSENHKKNAEKMKNDKDTSGREAPV